MPKIKNMEQIIDETLTQQPQEIQPQAPQIPEPILVPNDGNPTPPPPVQETAPADSLPLGLEMTTPTTNYTQEEFRQKFAGVLEFLENPATANNCIQELVTNGRNLTADKIYSVASRYSWLNWIIDRQTQVFADCLQIAAFLAIESNVIVMNWTGLNMFERVKLWLQNKAEQIRQERREGKRKTLFGWVFSGRAAAEKHTEQSNFAKD